MKTPLVLVTAALTIAILIAASFLIATGIRDQRRVTDLVGQTDHPGNTDYVQSSRRGANHDADANLRAAD